ncbi:MAG: winged helix-turn-helix domain-containing protein [Candidatus Ranarchaeia archaeon]|jgi:DNA-binding PadR family transcriptional regulator
MIDVAEVIGDVGTRRFILEKLLEGPVSGVKLRELIGEKNKLPPHKISDTLIYYNLSALRKANYIESIRYWRHKVYQLTTKAVPKVRKYFDIAAPLAYIGAIDSEDMTPVAIGRHLRETLNLDPNRYFMIIAGSTRGRWKPPGSEFVQFTEDVWSKDYHQVLSVIRKVIDKNINEMTFVVDVGGGPKTCSLALFKLAMDYDFPCINSWKLQKTPSWITNFPNQD